MGIDDVRAANGREFDYFAATRCVRKVGDLAHGGWRDGSRVLVFVPFHGDRCAVVCRNVSGLVGSE